MYLLNTHQPADCNQQTTGREGKIVKGLESHTKELGPVTAETGCFLKRAWHAECTCGEKGTWLPVHGQHPGLWDRCSVWFPLSASTRLNTLLDVPDTDSTGLLSICRYLRNKLEETFEVGCLTVTNSYPSSVCALCYVAFLLLPSRDRRTLSGTSLVVQWLRLGTPNAGSPGLFDPWSGY